MPEEGAAKETPRGTTPGWDGVHSGGQGSWSVLVGAGWQERGLVGWAGDKYRISLRFWSLSLKKKKKPLKSSK